MIPDVIVLAFLTGLGLGAACYRLAAIGLELVSIMREET